MQQPLTSVQLSGAAQPGGSTLPQRPRNIEETGLSLSFISDMIVRALYLIGEMTGQQIVDLIHLPYDNVVDQAITYLRREQMCEIKGTGGIAARDGSRTEVDRNAGGAVDVTGGVRAAAAIQGIRAQAAVERVVTKVPVKDVITIKTIDGIGGSRAVKGIVTARAVDDGHIHALRSRVVISIE